MKLHNIFNRVDETLNGPPLKFNKISNTLFVINLDMDNTIEVRLLHKVIQQLKCTSILFSSPKNKDPFELTKFFNGPGAIRIFTTISTIVEPYDPDVVVFIPIGTDVEVENKKTKLYRVVMRKLQLMGKLNGIEELQLDEYDKPIFVGTRKKASSLSTETLSDVVKQFGISKFV